jgi:hypothetical protein
LQWRDKTGQPGAVAVKFGTKKMEGTMLEGDTASVKDVYDLNIKEGRFFEDSDVERSANVVVLGNDTAEGLFGTVNAIGQDVTIAGMVFTVVGVMDKQKQAFGGGKNPEDNKAFFPVTTFHKIHPEVLDYWISLKFDDQKNKQLVQDELTELLRRRRKVANEKPDNFAIRHRLADAALGSDHLRSFRADALAVGGGAAGGWSRRNEHHAGQCDGTNARDRGAEGHWCVEADDSGTVHAGGDYALRCRRVDGCAVRKRARARGASGISVAALADMDDCGLYQFLRDWVGVWDLSGVEGGESESDRCAAL